MSHNARAKERRRVRANDCLRAGRIYRDKHRKGGRHQAGVAELESWARMMRELPLNMLKFFGRH